MKLTHKQRIYQIINNYIWEVRFCVFLFSLLFALVPQIPQSDCVFSSGGRKTAIFSKKLLVISSFLFLALIFFLFTVDVICSYFCSFLRWTLRLLMWDHFFHAIHFLLNTILAAFYKFWYVMSSFSLCSKYVLISFVISSLIHGLFRSLLFSFLIYFWILQIAGINFLFSLYTK